MASIVQRGSSYSVVYYTKENGIRKQTWESFRTEKDALHRKYVVEHSGHSQADMITEIYGHILDANRRKNTERFEEAFYQNCGTISCNRT